MKRLLLIVLGLLLSVGTSKAQLELSIETDKDTYDYGEPIQIICTILNPKDTQISFMHGSTQSCQAEFIFNSKDSYNWNICLPMSEMLIFSPGGSRKYTWLIDPQIFGLPNLDGEQRIIGYFLGHEEVFTKGRDTTYVTAPLFLGGEFGVGYPAENDSSVAKFKDSLDIITLYSFEVSGRKSEMWRFAGIQFDSLFFFINNDSRFSYAEFFPSLRYESITSVQENNSIPISFTISNAYPNPFNPTTSFYVEHSETQPVIIDLYNSLGEKVSTIFNGVINGGNRKTFQINGSNLASGIYYYRIESKNFFKTKKIVLLK